MVNLSYLSMMTLDHARPSVERLQKHVPTRLVNPTQTLQKSYGRMN